MTHIEVTSMCEHGRRKFTTWVILLEMVLFHYLAIRWLPWQHTTAVLCTASLKQSKPKSKTLSKSFKVTSTCVHIGRKFTISPILVEIVVMVTKQFCAVIGISDNDIYQIEKV